MNIFSNMKQLLSDELDVLDNSKQNYVFNPSKDFTRNRKLSFKDVISLIISMESGTIRSEILKYFSFSIDVPSPSAFIQQRSKIKTEAFQDLFHSFTDKLPSKTKEGFRVFAVDGSELLIPLEGCVDKYTYFKRSGQNPYHQLHLNAVYDLVSSNYCTVRIEPRKGHDERKAFHSILENHPFPEQSVFIFDRGYEGYALMNHLIQKNQFFVIRAKDRTTGGILKGVQLPDTDEFDFYFDKILVSYPLSKSQAESGRYHRIHYSKNPYLYSGEKRELQMSFRIVRVHLEDDKYECLLTNLPSAKYDLDQLKELYHMRWGIETSFRHLKHSIGLLDFHSKKVEFIEQEIWARLTLYNFCMAVTSKMEVLSRDTKHEYKCNVANAINVCRRFLKKLVNGTPPDIDLLISRELLPIRPNRKVPRKSLNSYSHKFNYRVL